MMIWVERASLVFGIGWSSRQIQRTTWPDCGVDITETDQLSSQDTSVVRGVVTKSPVGWGGG